MQYRTASGATGENDSAFVELIDRMPAQRIESDDLQRIAVGGLQKHDLRCGAAFVGFQPARGAQTPAIPGLEAGEAVFGGAAYSSRCRGT